MLNELLHLDKELFLFLNNLGSSTWDGFWLWITKTWGSLPVYVLLAWLSYRSLGLKRFLVLLVAVTLLILVTDQFSSFVKLGTHRLRPCYDASLNGLMRLVKASCGGRYGYFSAHAANATAVAVFFVHILGKDVRYFRAFILLWAFLVAYSRIYIGVHFPLDMLSGIGVGALLGWIFARLFLKFIEDTKAVAPKN
ncbi:phosphatase PAP2 family protein [Arenibacter sp. GZD96]|uniref:phosphatase PAP2 family protein n=1 Tax=Aurantibrevibacter litoralis TaxID=3106030 RepID=UPI002B002BDE|nr:phosphatase PAP2 family protein [Arenibacter sp. GZD-96]MEA1785040.1 phosphatase PAP2 family protein [Arenibacter sp. GZD-96]